MEIRVKQLTNWRVFRAEFRHYHC